MIKSQSSPGVRVQKIVKDRTYAIIEILLPQHEDLPGCKPKQNKEIKNKNRSSHIGKYFLRQVLDSG